MSRPKRRGFVLIVIAIAIFLAIFLILKIPLTTQLHKELLLDLYQEGAVIGQTTLVLEGELSRSLWRGQEFTGHLELGYCPKSQQEDISTLIYWYNGIQWGQKRVDLISFPAMFFTEAQDLHLLPEDMGFGIFCMDPAMDKAVIFLSDGTAAATSLHDYEKMAPFIHYNPKTYSYIVDAGAPVL